MQWDILTRGHVVRETEHICNGYENGNRVSILEVKVSFHILCMFIHSEIWYAFSICLIIANLITASFMHFQSPENQIIVTLLQESYTTCTASYVAFAPIEASTLDMILNGGSPDNVHILPSGFSILPDGLNVGGGSLVTMAFQILDSSSSATYIPPDSVATIFKLVTETAERIRAAMFNPSDLVPWWGDIKLSPVLYYFSKFSNLFSFMQKNWSFV